ncbi:fructose-bisphosphate aldolase [Plakobranchus ocellatus]|uniref:fructose-bisphosphate aldolase n=1 Tax=Plakobranchus ocellatus TaxID=259542 RepID=A0AAV3ZYC8_9GAST|nr:fructose-bisphosphate aldolase [Plakobranchus ocellatus]
MEGELVAPQKQIKILKSPKSPAGSSRDMLSVSSRVRKSVTCAAKKLRKKARVSREQRELMQLLQSRFAQFPSDEDVLKLRRTAKWLVRPGLGILAADDSVYQTDATLKSFELSASFQNRRKLYDVFLGSQLELDTCLSGVLLREDTVFYTWHGGKKLTRLIQEHKLKLGFRLDKGVVHLPGTSGEYGTWGLDTLEDTCKRIKEKGAEFALWRCVYRITPTTPSRQAILENSTTLALFAMICQTYGLVPIVSAEVLQQGDHDGEEARQSMREILVGLVKALQDHHVLLEGTLVRVTAAAPGCCYKGCQDTGQVAANTIKTLNECLPPAIGGVFLAREHNLARSLTLLNDIQNCKIKKAFSISFCFSRVIQSDAVSTWAGQDKNLDRARTQLMTRLQVRYIHADEEAPGKIHTC